MSQGEQGVPGTRGRVLVVDDDAALAEMLTIVLRNEGFEPVVCPTGDRALALLREHRPELVLLDLMLPGKDGTLDYLRPDGKTQVSVRYRDGVPVGIEKLLISTQHAEGCEPDLADADALERALGREALAERAQHRHLGVSPFDPGPAGGGQARVGNVKAGHGRPAPTSDLRPDARRRIPA